MRRSTCALIVATTVTAASAVAFAYSPDTLAVASPALPQASKPVPSSEASIKAGATIYNRSCRDCHGLRGRGDGIAAPPGTKPANLVDAEWKHGSTDADIYKVISEGIDPFDVMKPLRKVLPPNDIWNVINYIRSLAQPKK
jgi:mono/diheme cytochrome c family protein